MAAFAQQIAIGGYIPGNSFLHRLDPRTKLVGFLLGLTTVFPSAKLQGVVFTAIGVVALGLLCRAGWRIWFQGLSRFVLMLGIVGSVNLFFHPWGSPVTIGGWELPFTYDGVNSSVLLTVQLAEVIALSMVLTFTTTPMELTKACRRLAMPLKRLRVPVEELEIIMLLAMRFVPLLQGEVRLTVEAQRARGVDFGHGGLVSRSRNLVALLVPALTATLRRADLVAAAMTARGFSPGRTRSEYSPLMFSRLDYASFVCLALFLSFRILMLN
jgi:energy-coupling factor transport system permease protein